MTPYRIYYRLTHFFTARHWRGHSVHSPMMFAFIREVVVPFKGRKRLDALLGYLGEENVFVTDDAHRLVECPLPVAVLRQPFRCAREYRVFQEFYGSNHLVAALLPDMIVLFFDPKLQKQYYRIRG